MIDAPDRPAGAAPPLTSHVSVIIVHYNGLDQLRACLDSVRSSDARDSEIVVIDNASLDSCTEAIGPTYPDVRFVKSTENLGTAGGWNLGVRSAKGEILVFLNDDVLVEARWLDDLRSDLDDPRTGCSSGIALFLNERETINSAGGLLDFLGFGQNRGIGQPAAGFSNPLQPRPFYAVGTVFATRRSVWEASGGFDEAMFMYADDLDWSWRVRLLGYRIVLNERVIVYHKWRGSGLNFERMVYFLERNETRALLKNYGAAALLWIAPVFACVKLAKAFAFAVLDRRLLRAILGAWFWNGVNLPGTLRIRKQVQARRQVPDREIIEHMVLGSLELRDAFGWTPHPLRSHVGDRRGR